MDGLVEWLGIGSGFSTLAIGIIGLWLGRRKDKESLKALLDLVALYRKDVEMRQGFNPAQNALQREWIDLQRQIHEAEERWRNLTAVGKVIKFFAENSDRLE